MLTAQERKELEFTYWVNKAFTEYLDNNPGLSYEDTQRILEFIKEAKETVAYSDETF